MRTRATMGLLTRQSIGVDIFNDCGTRMAPCDHLVALNHHHLLQWALKKGALACLQATDSVESCRILQLFVARNAASRAGLVASAGKQQCSGLGWTVRERRAFGMPAAAIAAGRAGGPVSSASLPRPPSSSSAL